MSTTLARPPAPPATPRLVSVTTPVPVEVWRRVHESDPLGVVSQTPEYVAAIVACGARDASRLYVTDQGREIILPMVRTRRVPAALGVHRSFDAHWDIGGPIAAGGVSHDEVALVLADLGSSHGMALRLTPNPLTADAWRAALPASAIAIPRRAHVIELDVDYETLARERFKRRVRRNMKLAIEHGVEVRSGNGLELIDAFDRLFWRSVERWSRQSNEPLWLARLRNRRVQSVERLHALREHLGDRFRMHLAYLGGRPAAGIVVMHSSNTTDFRGAMDVELASPSRANYALQAMAIREACEAGHRWYHLGESGWHEGLALFKEGFGAVAYEYEEIRIETVPITRSDRALRGMVKRLIGFRERGAAPSEAPSDESR